ncbi:MAG: hypothetical protein U9Q82_05750 [Chloroflexota bacterium]|nr:hypothetical protein [Chloroflexota bacterium]
MSRQVTLTLPNDLYEQAQQWAMITQQDLSETLADALSIALTPVYTAPRLEKPVKTLSNEEIQELCNTRIESDQGRQLSQLLEKQREGILSDDERKEMLALMQIYHRLWIRQSEALAEAVRRGQRKPLES